MRFLTAGESHGPGVLAVIDGVPAGLAVSPAEIDADLRRRQLGYGRGARQKIERDAVRITGGVRQGRTTGAPIALQIDNRDAVNWERVMSVEPVAEPPDAVTRLRPGHADLAGALKFGHEDVRDVIERASARETAARVAAGAIAQALMSIQSAKGVQFADAFVASHERGSAVHDPIAVEGGAFVRSRNRAGGLEGGVTNGEDIVVEIAFKPISTLMKPLPSADLRTGAPSPAHVERSDVCVIPAAGVVAEAMLALVLADALCEKFGNDSVDDLCAAVERYRQRLRPIDAR